ncbi:MAG: tRNA (adenosine(37)-N6)-threonylcarbamoyltransferase complex ATPase subunit type 1 TsaE [Saprospiraceae bacterium]|nr:tRNA (adenosine(37)-N6)-threonylcarbamoyltransferase complex ATPase subunit type 1 TsaE [Candidatus Vicinibacter affinis]MBP6171955.1 tRNA (adenosine(37)-N6)-threonylcarbamoyltransferase complex ATPase subunit type 1 TsaE [Saprospiraceae bacterium]MBK6573123.1 tRNA (adenosine(37)-N6)-threonylcarbamoyltransferase complex ATPase subunit type 1 TsaE [Candidatus Vicinibacter affinis]MBK6822416.1 tRNA (adenosine(37)-N6)-threonylcarbamoyltransferase complex ATPase subunit type 1 TsaE [Candidatus Vi
MEFFSNEKHLESILTQLVNHLKTNRVWLLTGEMGSGKTTLVRNLGSLLGFEKEVTSPSYSIINEYSCKNNLLNINRVYHVDLYRLNHIEEALEVGIEEIIFGNDLVIIEWPNLIYPLLGKHTFAEIHIEVLDNQNRRYILKQNK